MVSLGYTGKLLKNSKRNYFHKRSFPQKNHPKHRINDSTQESYLELTLKNKKIVLYRKFFPQKTIPKVVSMHVNRRDNEM